MACMLLLMFQNSGEEKIINTENGKHSVCSVKKREFFHKKLLSLTENSGEVGIEDDVSADKG